MKKVTFYVKGYSDSYIEPTVLSEGCWCFSYFKLKDKSKNVFYLYIKTIKDYEFHNKIYLFHSDKTIVSFSEISSIINVLLIHLYFIPQDDIVDKDFK